MAHHPLYRDPNLATGLAAAPAPGREEVTEVSQLPAHRLELHVFTNPELAIAFADGVRLAGGNSVACHREAESREGRLVVVAFMGEDRDPAAATVAEAVRAVSHGHSGEESRLIERHLTVVRAKREREYAERKAFVRPVLELLRGAGIDASYDGNTGHQLYSSWGRFDGGCRIEPAKGDPGVWVVEAVWRLEQDYLWEREVDPRLAAVLQSYGLTVVDGGEAGAFQPVAPSELPRLVALARESGDRLKPVMPEIWRERHAAAEAERKRRVKEAIRERARQRRAVRA